MCILLKLDYAKFGVSNLFFSKVIEEKPLGGGLDPPLVKERLKLNYIIAFVRKCVRQIKWVVFCPANFIG